MKNVLHAYGVLASPLQLSAALTRLNVSHVLIDNTLQSRHSFRDRGVKQPAWPVVVPSLAAFKRYQLDLERQVVYVCGPLAELQETNLRVIKDWNNHLDASLRYAVVNPFDPKWELQVTEQSMSEFVKKATKESFVNHIQAELYHLTPYDLRKTVQVMVIGYLAGTVKWNTLRQKLNSSYKLERLKALMAAPQCAVLKEAVAEYRKTSLEEVVAKQFGVEPFEIMYVVKSSAKAAI